MNPALSADIPQPRRRAVITGIGLVNPLGMERGEFWRRLTDGASAVANIDRFDTTGLPVGLAAQVRDFDATAYLSRRLVVKSDLFSHYALAATSAALADARLNLSEIDPHRVGISFGNNSGGWDICERGFREYYGQGPRLVNPWQATAWFPSAAQGFVSIQHGIRGYSKSFACDRASGGCAVLFAERLIAWGRADVVFTGGAEAPLTRFGIVSYLTTGEISHSTDSATAYRPFDRDRDGLVLGEGSTVLVVEELAHAQLRGARIYGEILAVTQRVDNPASGAGVACAITAAMRAGERDAADIGLVLAEGSGTVQGDRAEAEGIATALGRHGQCVPVTVPKSAYGHLYGASFATELACGLLALTTGLIPPTVGTRHMDSACGLNLLTHAERLTISAFLVLASSREGVSIALVAGGVNIFGRQIELDARREMR
jgi:3-oxoacyl-(acyl-carrier-protein) synthase